MEKRISVAPMMGQTDRHFRYMISLLANDVRLYTPMIHADAIVYSDNWKLSLARADETFNYLLSKGISAEKIIALGYADRWPLESLGKI